MMIRRITSLYQFGTEFRIGAYRGTQFRQNRPISSKNEIYHIKDRNTEVAKRGVMYMATKIEVHDDYCIDLDNAEIESILSQITALITNAVLRGVYQTEVAA